MWVLIMPISILDACAMLAFLQNEPGAEAVEEILTRPNESCLAHAINLCEVYYTIYRRSDEATAREAISDLERVGIVERNDLDKPFWNEAGKQRALILASGNRIALADCFAIALALLVGGTVVTSDHHEFGYVQSSGICPVNFFR